MRPRYLIALLLLIPLADALLLVWFATFVGWQVTVALVVLTGLIGMLLVRSEGRSALARLQRKVSRAEIPADELLDGAFLIAAGAFLLTPGLVTDAIGFLFAVPVTRYPMRAALKRWVVVPYLDKRTDGLTTGRVWTFGFPDDDRGSYGPDGGFSPDGGSDPGPNSGAGFGSRSGSGSESVGSGVDIDFDDVVDVDSDSYRVEDEDDEGGTSGR